MVTPVLTGGDATTDIYPAEGVISIADGVLQASLLISVIPDDLPEVSMSTNAI